MLRLKTRGQWSMRRKRRLLLIATGLVLIALFVRVGYDRLGWGGYLHIDVAAPWRR